LGIKIYSKTSIYAELTIEKDDFNPDDITQILGILPTKAY